MHDSIHYNHNSFMSRLDYFLVYSINPTRDIIILIESTS